MDIVCRRRIGRGSFRGVVGVDGEISVAAWRGPADPAFHLEPSYFWDVQSIRHIEIEFPLMVAWQRGPVLVFGCMTPRWDWYSKASLVDGHVKHVRHGWLSMSNYALGCVYEPSERLSLGLFPSFGESTLILRLELGFAW